MINKYIPWLTLGSSLALIAITTYGVFILPKKIHQDFINNIPINPALESFANFSGKMGGTFTYFVLCLWQFRLVF